MATAALAEAVISRMRLRIFMDLPLRFETVRAPSLSSLPGKTSAVMCIMTYGYERMVVGVSSRGPLPEVRNRRQWQ